MTQFQKDFVALMRAALTEEAPVVSKDIDLDGIFSLAEENKVVPLVYYGALKLPEFQKYAGKMNVIRSVCRDIALDKNQQKEIGALCREMDSRGMAYCLLKGTEMKTLYPKSEMRYMNDADILIHWEEMPKINGYLKDSGFTKGHESDHELVWSKPGMEIEFHTNAFDRRFKKEFSYMKGMWERVTAGHFLEPEFSFVYELAHLSKHVRVGSLPIRHVTDLYVYRKSHPELCLEDCRKELGSMGLEKFFDCMMELVDRWFCDGKESPLTDQMTEMALRSRDERKKRYNYHFEADKVKKGKLAYAVERIFPGYDFMCKRYGVLTRHPVLLPGCWILRIISYIVMPKKEKTENRLDLVYEETELDDFRKELDMLGLKDRIG